jgi:hypothetical protein
MRATMLITVAALSASASLGVSLHATEYWQPSVLLSTNRRRA